MLGSGAALFQHRGSVPGSVPRSSGVRIGLQSRLMVLVAHARTGATEHGERVTRSGDPAFRRFYGKLEDASSDVPDLVLL